ncbi:olfactory receptor 6N2-like [Pygocentrus nattereri]|uniref:Olfactory receptor n=1 Tax=Pygocentrus nattereri TaxID=42514 RepID=A0A3B4DIF2_PYGNA|nr:olfactory receptor 6N2-like [Pygocentrus nattereri]
MDYSTNLTFISLEGHVELEKYRYVYFVICLSVFILIIFCNSVVISVIYANKPLHEPMYIFIAALLSNDLIATVAFYPKLLSDFVSEKQIISQGGCLVQTFCLYTCTGSEFALLSAMAYDRYVSICKPLEYATLVKMSTVKKLLFFCWFVPSCEMGIAVILSYRPLCRFKLNRIYCNSYSVNKLTCGDLTVVNLYGMIVLPLVVCPPVMFVIYSYIRILHVCLKNSKDFRRKALQTCFPHLFIFTTFSVIVCFEVINSRLEGNIPHLFSVIMSIQNLFISPLLNPIMYGLKLQEIWNRIKRMFWKKKTHIFVN